MSRNNSGQIYSTIQKGLAKVYNVKSVSQSYSVNPSTAQSLNDKISEKADFLERINVIPVGELVGEKVMLGVSGPISSRTDTRTTEREPKDLSDIGSTRYELVQTETDVCLSFAKIDAWGKYPDFLERYMAAVHRQIALDRIIVGFRGTHCAAQTDRETYPMLEDVNKGWLQQAREQVPAQVLTQGLEAGKIRLGSGGDYENLDALVHGVKQLIDEVLRDSGDLIVIVGRNLLDREKATLYAKQAGTPTEKERIESAQVINTYGGLPSYSVPYFPGNSVLVTSWDNLSIYYQESSWRAQTVENSRRNRVEDYSSRNEGYIVEYFEKLAMAENIEPV